MQHADRHIDFACRWQQQLIAPMLCLPAGGPHLLMKVAVHQAGPILEAAARMCCACSETQLGP